VSGGHLYRRGIAARKIDVDDRSIPHAFNAPQLWLPLLRARWGGQAP
jgi:hypothetical protein